MGISRDSWHKRVKTGAICPIPHKKKKFELGRPAANTKIGVRRVRLIRTRGGGHKSRSLRLDSGNFSWGSEQITRKTRIVDTMYNATNNELVRTKTLVKGAIVSVDANPFRQWYEAHYAVPLARKKTAKRSEEEDAILNKKRSNHTLKKFTERRKTAAVDALLAEQARIVDTLYNATNSGLGRARTLAKVAIVSVDASPFCQWYEAHYAVPLARKKKPFEEENAILNPREGSDHKKKNAKLSEEDTAILHKKKSNRTAKKYTDRQKSGAVDVLLIERFQHGRLPARICSSPGQVGSANGYILEGRELEFYVRKIRAEKTK